MGFFRRLFSGLPSSEPAPASPAKGGRATKGDVKALFRAIRNGDEATVKSIVAANGDFVHARAAAPPRKDDGQSPLQVALKTGRFAISDYLIEHGADVNFMEESAVNEWRTPALHDAIRAAMFSTGSAEFKPAIAVIRKMLQRGADPNAADSYGNNCLMRAILDARMRIRAEGPSASPQLMKDVGEIFETLIQVGADVHARGPDRASAVEETLGSELARFVTG